MMKLTLVAATMALIAATMALIAAALAVMASTNAALAAPPDPRRCLAEALYFEARNQGWKGMLAVGVVAQNRVRSKAYPNDICAVVRQGRLSDGKMKLYACQFTYWCDGKPERPADQEAWEAASNIAAMLLSTNITIEGMQKATHYHTTTVQPRWARKWKPCRRIRQHIFYCKESGE